MAFDQVVLTAGAGDLTVTRTASAFVYGARSVQLPAGAESADDPHYSNGYVYRPPNRSRGRFDLAFVRADVKVNTGDGHGRFASSDMESVLDAATQRSEGRVYFQRDITGRGLGRFVPGRDFDTGDLVQVAMWGKTIPAQVTECTVSVDDTEGLAYAVHVGGDAIRDSHKLLQHNAAIDDKINQERYRVQQELDRQREQQQRDAARLGGQITQLQGQIASLQSSSTAAADAATRYTAEARALVAQAVDGLQKKIDTAQNMAIAYNTEQTKVNNNLIQQIGQAQSGVSENAGYIDRILRQNQKLLFGINNTRIRADHHNLVGHPQSSPIDAVIYKIARSEGASRGTTIYFQWSRVFNQGNGFAVLLCEGVDGRMYTKKVDQTVLWQEFPCAGPVELVMVLYSWKNGDV